MSRNIFNFSAGPAVLPRPVLEKAREGLLSINGTGLSIMEVSHRSDYFEPILAAAEQGLRDLLRLPAHYKVLFLQGGASFQFSMVPLNFLAVGGFAQYIITGAWGKKAIAEAAKCGESRTLFTSEQDGFRSTPQQDSLNVDPDARYLHYTSNETIEGVEFKYEIDGKGVPVVCDASSNILSKPFDIEKYAILYAGAQKNIGPSGVTVVVIRDDMLERVPSGQHSLLDYKKISDNRSMLNTPNTWGIYIVSLVCEWLKQQGGPEAMEARNAEKAAAIYDAIDSSDGFYTGHAERNSRSHMNVTFRLPSEELDDRFCEDARSEGLDGLRGHRSVGGVRASIYNAFPLDGAKCLAEFMKDFSAKNG